MEELWEETKIPNADRKFYRESLCKGPPAGIEQCRDLANYVMMLKAHRKATIAVLRAIEIREFAVSKCFDLLYAINRKAARAAGSRSAAALQDPSKSLTRATVRDLSGTHGVGTQRGAATDSITAVFQEELVALLRDVQVGTHMTAASQQIHPFYPSPCPLRSCSWPHSTSSG